MEATPGNYYNFHPGSHVGQGIEVGIQKIAEVLNAVLTEDQTTTVLLETMSGKGSEVGSHFEELRAIMDLVEKRDKLGICLDTCHVSDGGYDIIHNLDGVLTEFDRVIGLHRLKAVHLNDSQNPTAPARTGTHVSVRGASDWRRWGGLSGIRRCGIFPSAWRLPTSCRVTPGRLP